jgi:hypothetical protein
MHGFRTSPTRSAGFQQRPTEPGSMPQVARRTILRSDTILTSHCNQLHSLLTGHPVNHECYCLSLQGLKDEALGSAVSIESIRTDRILNPIEMMVVDK